MKFGLRFYLSWIIAAVIMFVLFYTWHGVFLNDFKRIHFPMVWFVTFAAITYLILGAVIYLVYESELLRKIQNIFIRGLVCGAGTGFALFMVTTIINISLTRNQSIKHLMMDCIWQIFEQIVGAMMLTLLKIFIQEPMQENANA
jgi:hypothetical protein